MFVSMRMAFKLSTTLVMYCLPSLLPYPPTDPHAFSLLCHLIYNRWTKRERRRKRKRRAAVSSPNRHVEVVDVVLHLRQRIRTPDNLDFFTIFPSHLARILELTVRRPVVVIVIEIFDRWRISRLYCQAIGGPKLA